MNLFKKTLTYILVAFAILSLGFILGKHYHPQEDSQPMPKQAGTYLAIYNLHATIRCTTCNKIESMTKEFLAQNYQNKIDQGTIKWQSIDFEQNPKMAKEYEVISSCVVLAIIQDNISLEYKRLDEVWTTMQNPASFNQYLEQEISPLINKMATLKPCI